jgi:protein O-mannosyl-transferase
VSSVSSSERRSSVAAAIAAAIAVALLTFVAFAPTLANDFVTWDDDRNFLQNPMYRGLGREQLHWMWTTFHMGHYVPLSWMTLGLDYKLWGMDARGYHFTNVLFHSANALLLFFIGLRLLRACMPARTAGSPGTTIFAAAFGVLIFAVHPLRVESVAWVTERRDVLSGFLVSASLLCYLRFVSGARRGAYWCSLGLFVCALLSKATSLTLPAVLLILNVYPFRRLGGEASWVGAEAKRVYLEIIPFALLAIATVPLTILALAPGTQLSLPAKIAVSAYSLMFYLWKTLVPTGLSPLYAMPRHVDPAAMKFIGGYAVVVAALAAAWLARRRFPSVPLAIAVFFAVILPMLGIVQNGPQIAADRYTYHASPALALLAGGALFPLFDGAWSKAWRVLAAVVIAALMALTWRQTQVWHDPERFWSYVLRTDSTSSLAHTMVANIDLHAGRLDDAIANYRSSIDIDPTFADSHDNLGIALARQGRFAEAAPEFRAAIAINPLDREIHNNLGVADTHLGNFAEALSEFSRALAIDPSYADAETNWGNALVQMGRPADAVAHYARASELQPNNAEAHLNWGVALARQGRMDDAAEQFRRVLAIDPANADASGYLEKALAMRGRSK